MARKHQWQGEDVKVKYGYCDIFVNKEKPLWWTNFFVKGLGQHSLFAIKVIPKSGDGFVISNVCGIGEEKLLRGGWPDFPHSSLDANNFVEVKTFQPDFDPNSYNGLSQQSANWFQSNYGDTEEYKKMEAMRKMVLKGKESVNKKVIENLNKMSGR